MRRVRIVPPAAVVALAPLLVVAAGACGNDDTVMAGAADATTRQTTVVDAEYEEALDRLVEMKESGMSDEEIEDALEALEHPPAPVAVEASVPIVAVFGDSSSMMTGLGLGDYGRLHPDVLQAGGGWSKLGCGVTPAGARRVRGTVTPIPEICARWVEDWRATAAVEEADIALVQLGPWEVVDTRVEGATEFTHVGEPEHDASLIEGFVSGIQALVDEGEFVVVVTSPTVTFRDDDGADPEPPFPESDPARVARWNAIVEEAAARFPTEEVAVVDLGGHVDGLPPAEVLRLMPDGVHFTWDTATEVADWLGPEIVEAWATRSP